MLYMCNLYFRKMNGVDEKKSHESSMLCYTVSTSWRVYLILYEGVFLCEYAIFYKCIIPYLKFWSDLVIIFTLEVLKLQVLLGADFYVNFYMSPFLIIITN